MRSFLLLGLAGCNGLASIDAPDPEALDAVSRAQVDLGHQLFFDEGLSRDGDVSCATCHQPEHFGAEPRATSMGTGGAVLPRNAPSVLNASLKTLQFWDGRADTLEDQALGPLLSPDEMGQTQAGIEAHVAERYAEAFATAFPGEDGPTLDQVTRALAAYQRMLPSRSAFDRFLDGERDALSPDARRGLTQFRNLCAFCHGGPGVGGEQLERLGDEIPWPEDQVSDLGRIEITGDPGDRLVFVVPSLRNVSRTGPWFHDGSVETLEEAVELMARHQVGQELSEAEIADLVAFLESLDAEALPEWFRAP